MSEPTIEIFLNDMYTAEDFWIAFEAIRYGDIPFCLRSFHDPGGEQYACVPVAEAERAHRWASAIPGFVVDGRPALIFEGLWY